MSRSETLRIIAGDDGIISSSMEDATDRGHGISLGCIEPISTVVYPVDGSLGLASAISYFELEILSNSAWQTCYCKI